jgi:hypothetical protein
VSGFSRTLVFDSSEAPQQMVMNVEIELRIPTLTIRKENDEVGRIDNTHVRFRRIIEVPAFPQPGSAIQLHIGDKLAFECTVARADWHEEKQLFVLACRYPNTRIFPEQYEALLNDTEWTRTELPA